MLADSAGVMKLMSTSDGACGSQNGFQIRPNLAVAEINESVRHLYAGGYNAHHLCAVDRFCEVHQAATFGVELPAGFYEAPNRSAHGSVRLKLVPVELGITAPNVEKVGVWDLVVADRRELDDLSAGILQCQAIRVIVERERLVVGERDAMGTKIPLLS